MRPHAGFELLGKGCVRERFGVSCRSGTGPRSFECVRVRVLSCWERAVCGKDSECAAVRKNSLRAVLAASGICRMQRLKHRFAVRGTGNRRFSGSVLEASWLRAMGTDHRQLGGRGSGLACRLGRRSFACHWHAAVSAPAPVGALFVCHRHTAPFEKAGETFDPRQVCACLFLCAASVGQLPLPIFVIGGSS